MHDSFIVEVQFAGLLVAEDSEKGGEEVKVARKLAKTVDTLTEKTEKERKAKTAQSRSANVQLEEKVSKELEEKLAVQSTNTGDDANVSSQEDSETYPKTDAERSGQSGATQDMDILKNAGKTEAFGHQPQPGAMIQGAIQTTDEKKDPNEKVSSDMQEVSVMATFTTIPDKLKRQIGELRESLRFAVLWELLSACIADIPEETEGHGLLPPGYDARHRSALRLLSCWLDVSWSKMVMSAHSIQPQHPVN